MSQNGFDGPLTLAAGVNHLPTLLKAAGYTGRFGATFATLTNKTGASLFYARRSTVSAAGATKGKELADQTPETFQAHGHGTIDFNQFYIYSAAGGEIDFSINTR
jgi:hypothetical protein